jgi:hypothetical protein
MGTRMLSSFESFHVIERGADWGWQAVAAA